jgi:hypothetical protein
MSIFWAYIKFRIAIAVLRLAGRVFALALLVAVLVAAAPITLVGPPRVFRTAKLSLFHAASCRFRYSSRASCGVRYPSPE